MFIGSTSSTANIAAANPEKSTTRCRSERRRTARRAKQRQSAVTRSSQRPRRRCRDRRSGSSASKHMLEERKCRDRVHRCTELTGPYTKQRVVQHVMSSFQPDTKASAESGLASS